MCTGGQAYYNGQDKPYYNYEDWDDMFSQGFHVVVISNMKKLDHRGAYFSMTRSNP
jgi:hypothetical protein